MLALIATTTRSKQETIGPKSFRLSTAGVLDLLGANEPQGQEKYTLVGMCSEKTLKDVLLDPPRSGKKQQAALAIITGVLGEKEFLLQVVQLIPESDLAAARKMMEALITLNRRTQFGGEGARPSWTIPSEGLVGNPRKCRRLGAGPTDTSFGGLDVGSLEM